MDNFSGSKFYRFDYKKTQQSTTCLNIDNNIQELPAL